MKSYPLYSPLVQLATISEVPIQVLSNGKKALKLVFDFGNYCQKSALITNPIHIETIYPWLGGKKTLESLVGKRLGIEIHEELGFITNIFNEDFSKNFCVFD